MICIFKIDFIQNQSQKDMKLLQNISSVGNVKANHQIIKLQMN